MNWLIRYKKDLDTLERVRGEAIPVDLSKPAEVEGFSKQLEAILAPLKGKKIDSKALDLITSRWWIEWKGAHTTSLKREIRIQLRLIPLYKRLKNASKAELEEFGLMVLRSRLRSRLFRELIGSLAEGQDNANVDSTPTKSSAASSESR